MEHFLIIIVAIVVVSSLTCHSFTMLNVFLHFANEHMFFSQCSTTGSRKLIKIIIITVIRLGIDHNTDKIKKSKKKCSISKFQRCAVLVGVVVAAVVLN